MTGTEYDLVHEFGEVQRELIVKATDSQQTMAADTVLVSISQNAAPCVEQDASRASHVKPLFSP